VISRALAVLIFCVGLFCLSQQPRAFYQSRDSNYNINVTTGGGFVGAGDTVAGAAAYWGLRAYTTATRGNKLLNVCNSTGGVDVGCADLFSDATTGILASATVSGITCPGANCTVKIAYELTGNTGCIGGLPCNVSQNTVATRPTLSSSCVGSNPCIVCHGTTSALASGSVNSSTAQPYTLSSVAKRTGSFTALQSAIAAGSNAVLGFGGSANTSLLFGGSSFTAAATDSAFHAMQGVVNNTSSVLTTDGVDQTGTAGTNATGTASFFLCDDGFGGSDAMTGQLLEAGLWSSGFTSGQRTSMNSNQHSTWGF
jgi:hypothetical protein